MKFKAENYDIIHSYVRKIGTPNCTGSQAPQAPQAPLLLAAGIGLGLVRLQLRLWSADRVTVSYSYITVLHI